MTKTESTTDFLRKLRRDTRVGGLIALLLVPCFTLIATVELLSTVELFSLVTQIGAVVIAAASLELAITAWRRLRLDDAALLRSAANASSGRMSFLACGMLLYGGGHSAAQLGIMAATLPIVWLIHTKGREAASAHLPKNVALSA